MSDDRDHTDPRPEDDCDGGEPRQSTDSGGNSVVPETTQNLDDFLAFLRADPQDMYDDLSADDRARVDRWREAYRQDVVSDAAAETDTDGLLTRVAVDRFRAGCATDVVVRNGLSGQDDRADLVRAVADELVRLSRRRRAGLRRLGVYPVDGGDTGNA